MIQLESHLSTFWIIVWKSMEQIQWFSSNYLIQDFKISKKKKKCFLLFQYVNQAEFLHFGYPQFVWIAIIGRSNPSEILQWLLWCCWSWNGFKSWIWRNGDNWGWWWWWWWWYKWRRIELDTLETFVQCSSTLNKYWSDMKYPSI